MKKIFFLRVFHVIIFFILITSVLLKFSKTYIELNININDNFIYLALGTLGLIWILIPEKSLNSLYFDITKVNVARTRIFGIAFLIASVKFFLA